MDFPRRELPEAVVWVGWLAGLRGLTIRSIRTSPMFDDGRVAIGRPPSDARHAQQGAVDQGAAAVDGFLCRSICLDI